MTPAQTLARHRNWLFPLFLLLATFIAYLPALHSGFIWDDEKYITNDPDLFSPHGLFNIWFHPRMQYYPLTFTTFWIEFHLWGLHAAGFHFVNIVLHALDAVLLWQVLLRLNIPGAWLAAGIFALHPINVESVAWIVERKNTLSTAFYLGSILAALKFWLPENTIRRSRGVPETPHVVSCDGFSDLKYYWLAFGLFVLALFSKTTTIPLPAVILLLVWWKRGKITSGDIGPCIPFFVVGVAMGAITHWAEARLEPPGPGLHIHFLDRLLIAGRDVWFYFGKFIWPYPLIPIYPRWKIDPASLLDWLPLLAIVTVLVFLWRSRRVWARSAFVALAYFLGLMFTVLGFFNVSFFHYSFVSDHFVYLACMGPFALAAAAITVGLQPNSSSSSPAAIPQSAVRSPQYLTISAFLLAVLATLTFCQCRIYPDNETFWRATAARNPDAFLAYNNLGDFFFRQGKIDDAIAEYQKSLALNPDPMVCHNLGYSLLQKGEPNEAVLLFQKSVQIAPEFAIGYADIGNYYLQIGRTIDAIEYLQKAVEIKPDYPPFPDGLGNAYLKNNQLDLAVKYWQKTVQIAPDFAPAQNNLANAAMMRGQVAEAVQHWKAALRAQPDMPGAMLNVAWIESTSPDARLRNGAEALALAQRLNQLSGGANPVVLRTLAAAYAETGQFSDAIATAQKAVQTAQGNRSLQWSLEEQLGFYRRNLPFREQNLVSK